LNFAAGLGYFSSVSNPFNLDSVRESLQRIVTTTQLRGFGRLCPTPHIPDCCVDETGCQAGAPEGPAVVLHGLASVIPSTPLHFILILEPGERIAIARIGAHRTRLQVLFGACEITARHVSRRVTGPDETSITSKAGSTIQFPVRLVPEGKLQDGAQAAFDAGDFPNDDTFPLYIESLGGLSILLVSRRQVIRDEAGAVKGIHELEVYASSSCDPRCQRECPHATAFPGVAAPDVQH
jgi:hypothetical protein